METTRRIAVLAFATIALACGVPASGDAPLKGYSSDKNRNLFGYYMPQGSPRFGKFVLRNITLGEPSDFTKYETGRNDIKQYAPVMFEFDDVTSQKKQGEMGEYYANAPRILPSAYKLSGGSLSFVGSDKQVGSVTFSGKLDAAKIKAAQAGGSLEAVVLTGNLTVGAKTMKNVTFTWFGGD
jgi:hypothetical protein